ncbi:hypothetical protein AOQ84DRAFT_384426 [Glonium stellatum]|uniref:Uncharacterized protein n=1 Tax=Glonium stellatum TaxID=574774 RepID=A0A8E2FDL1_9PEZI|nr:hypothetical protein AOQ84DRAFT_384426 [Glonium stellatum]
MPLTERDPNVSGRTSRASNMSTGSKGIQKGNSARPDLFSNAPGVMSMLRTSTEMGDIGTLTFDSTHLPSMPRASHPHRRSGAASRLSTGSAHSQASKRASNHHTRPSGSSGARRSLTRDTNVPQYLPDTLSPTLMNLQGSSPLIPHARLSRDGRSFSMTHTSQPVYTLSSHRSFASLRNQDIVPRPRSPYRYPARLRRPGYRPSSPAMSDITGTQPRRLHGQSFASRLRAPSGASMHSDERHQMPYPQGRNRSNTSFSAPPLDISTHHMFVSHARNHTPAKESMSSGSINQRTDSEAPSSDAPSSTPPTPKDGTSMEVLVSPTSTQALVVNMDCVAKADTSTGPLYYDYSEQFDREALCNQEPQQVPLGFVHRIKTILEERATIEQESMKVEVEVVQEVAELPASEVAELPASPVVKRITRDLILAAIGPASSIGETTSSVEVRTSEELADDPLADLADDHVESCGVSDEVTISPPPENADKRQSTISDVPSSNSIMSVPDSAIEFAVRYSIPMANTVEECQGDSHQDETAQEASELLEEPSSIKIDHSPKPSDGKSFKTCKESDSKSCKDSDGKSFKTCKDTVTPDRPAPIPTPRQSSQLSSRPASKLSSRPTSAIASASSSTETIPRPPSVIPLRESSSSKEAQRTQAVADFLVRLSQPRRLTREQYASKHNTLENAMEPPSASIDQQPSSTPCPILGIQSTPPDNITPESSAGRPSSNRSSTPKELGYRDSNTTTHLVWNARKPVPSLLTNAIEPRTSHRLSQDETTTDLRLSSFRYPVAYLPDVKEDLHEDSSINTSVGNLKSSSFKFPIVHPPSRRVSIEDFRLFKNPSVKSFQGPSSTSRGLTQTRNLPSLNFSRMDLIAKLNEALDMRSSKSLDGIPDDYRDLFSPILERRSSSGEIREKYKSFFASLDELEKPVEYVQPTPIMDLVPVRQMYSPKDLMVEIDNLTIPSVGGLTQRLSEYLPSLKRFYSGEDKDKDEDDIMEHALEEINEVGGPALNSARSSARLRPMPGNPHLVVIDDGIYEEMAHKDILRSRLVELSDCNASLYSKRSASHSRRGKTPLAELEAPMPAVLRTRSLSLSGNDEHRASFESKLARRSLRSLVGSPTDRPWNVDKNYPWADDVPAIDISLPAPTYHRDAPRPGPSRLRLRLSGSCSESQSDYGLYDESAVSPTTGDSTGSDDPFKHTRKVSKHSILESISRRIGIHTGPFDATGYAVGPDSLRNDDRSVDPGDRYPTTGLTPPSAFNLEEVRSFFSDDSSRSQRGGSFRKRLTHLKAKLPPVTRSHSALENRCLQNGDRSLKESRFAVRPGGSVHTYDGTVGMSKMEFRARKVVEKIKTLWFRSGELLRSMSGRRKPSQETRNWLHDSDVYSGT